MIWVKTFGRWHIKVKIVYVRPVPRKVADSRIAVPKIRDPFKLMQLYWLIDPAWSMDDGFLLLGDQVFKPWTFIHLKYVIANWDRKSALAHLVTIAYRGTLVYGGTTQSKIN